MATWKLYEDEILRKFREEFPDSDIKANQKILGVFSKCLRQIDILVTSETVGHKIIGVIECKYFNKKVDVKTVDAFISFLEDVQANLGILITNKGFTKGANNRADSKDIKIQIVEFDKLETYHFDWESCEACSVNEIGHREIHWHSPMNAKCKKKVVQILVGHCSYCGTTHFKCTKCGHIVTIWDGDYGNVQDCFCSNKYIVEYEYAGSGMNEEVFYLLCGRNKIEFMRNSEKMRISDL